ncbi:flagellar export protein FliJ [Thiomicrorhabdus aquaedulcis]|uniref:flagellar export protein FliJ n=1 Tax=Thiomicrorhabdus aquaedulcis TaxID=2211106 RepID=UPI000FDA1FCC|nr:flagellar export protein FliJ [Thiomicrorhabdus aquaedulcis]
MAANGQQRAKTMQTLVDLAQIELDNAAKSLAMFQAQLEQAKQQLASLMQYSAEYSTDLIATHRPLSPIQLQSRAAFGGRVQQAVAAQTTRVTEVEKMVEMANQQWLERRTRVKALQALLTKLKQGIQVQMNKREQQFMDELATQASLRK